MDVVYTKRQAPHINHVTTRPILAAKIAVLSFLGEGFGIATL